LSISLHRPFWGEQFFIVTPFASSKDTGVAIQGAAMRSLFVAWGAVWHVSRVALAVTAGSFLVGLGGCSQNSGTPIKPPPPEKELILVANGLSANLSAFTMSSADGILAPISGSPFSTQDNADGVAVDPKGRFAYVTLGSTPLGGVYAFTVTSGTGVLTPVSGAPFSGDTGSFPQSVAVDPSGKFVYTGNTGAYGVWAFTIDSTTGSLNQVTGSPYASCRECESVVVHPTGKFLYALSLGTNPVTNPASVVAYSIDATTGALSPLAGSPYPASSGPFGMTMHQSGNFLYVADYNSNTVSGYAIDANGGLSAVPGSPFPAGTNPIALAVDPSGKFLYSANWLSGDVSGYTINATTGALTKLSKSPFMAAVEGPHAIAVDPTGQFVLVGHSGGGVVFEFPIDLNSGNLGVAATFITGSYPDGVAIIAMP
jgi:6-phosphogluconolactonase